MPIRVNPDETFHVLFGQNVREMDLDALDLAYRADAIEDDTLLWQEGLGEWLRLDVVLERLAEQEAAEAAEAQPYYSMPAPAPAPDVYFVLVGPDDTKQMSLDQLDDAYRLDIIDEATLVWQPGFAEWIRLDQLLALADEAPAPSYSYSQAPAPSASSYPSQSAPAARSLGPQSYGYVIGRPADSTAPVTHSLAPALDLDDLEDLRPRPASPWYRRSLIAAAAAVALLGAHRSGLTAGLLPKSAAQASVETPAGVDGFLNQLEKQHGLDQLSATDAVPAASPVAASAPAKEVAERPSEPSPAPQSAAATPEATPTETQQVAPALSAAAPASPDAAALPLGPASRFSNTLQGKKPVGASRPAARPAKRAGTSSKAPKGSGLAYDPMNGTL